MQELYYLKSREFLQVLNKYLEKGQIKSFLAVRVILFVKLYWSCPIRLSGIFPQFGYPHFHEDDSREIFQKRVRNIYRVLFWTGPALKVLNMGLVPPNKKNDCFLLCIYAMHVCMWDTQVSVEYSCGSGSAWKGLPSWAPMGSHQTKTEPSFTQNSSPLLAMMMRMMILTIMLMMTMSDGTDPPLTQNLLFSPHGHRLHSDDQHRHLSPLRSWIEEGGGWN